MSPQPAVTLEKTKEKVSSKERVEGKGSGACNGEKPNPDNHPQNGEKSCQGHCSKPPVGDSYEWYRWSRCKQPLPLSSMHIKGVPSPPDNVEVSLLSLQVTLLLCVGQLSCLLKLNYSSISEANWNFRTQNHTF
jgi:hypothetical protein